MMPSPFMFLAVAYLGPIVLLIAFVFLRNLQTRKVLLAAEAEVQRKRKEGIAQNFPAIFYEPKPEPALGPLLRGFSLQQRTYLRQMFPLVQFGFITVTYMLLAASLAGLLPPTKHAIPSGLALVENYLSWLRYTGVWAVILSFFSAILALAQLQTPQAIFIRTRPLPFSFIFRARVGLALATLLVSVGTALLLSNVALIIVSGQLHSSAPWPIQSLLRADSMLLITCALVFAGALVLVALPSGKMPSKASGVIFFGFFGGIVGSQLVHVTKWLNLAGSWPDRAVSFALDPPSIVSTLAFPLAVVALLALAERLSSRTEF